MSEEAPRTEYERRLRRLDAEIDRLERLDRRLGNGRFAVFLVGAALLWPIFASQSLHVVWLLPPLAAFVVLVFIHGIVVRRLADRRLRNDFYRRGLARVTGDPPEPLEDGARFLPGDHPYAEDLDLFGRASLYGLLCTANSLVGRETLADWLLRPAPAEIVAARQEAVLELRGRLELQEDLWVVAAGLAPELTPDSLANWSSRPRRLEGAAWPAVMGLVGVGNVAAASAYLFGPLPAGALLLWLGLAAALGLVLRGRVSEVLESIRIPAAELRFLSNLLRRLESESFTGARLRELQRTALDSTGDDAEQRSDSPSEHLAQLVRWIEWNDSRSNQLFLPLAALVHLGTQIAFGVERWRARHGPSVEGWLRAVGEFEALSALASFSFENPEYAFPEVVGTETAVFEGSALMHPLLDESTRVPNDVSLSAGPSAGDGTQRNPPQLLLVSGSNMSGKSTLLRTVGVAAVLAYAGAPVPAARLRLSQLTIGASIRVHDSLEEGVSRFYAELRRLSLIRELAVAGPTLFLADEVLHGTNSHDRLLGARGVIRSLLDEGALGLVTTHDLALAAIVGELGERAENCHFEDHLEAGRMAFDYRLRPGVVEKGNAIALMKSLGLPVEAE